MNRICCGGIHNPVLGFFALLGTINIAAWIWAFAALRGNVVLLGTAFVAYTFGLRHAVDADHIAAIDNAARKLIQEGRKPLAVGLFFALGHSTVVLIVSLIAYQAAAVLENQFASIKKTLDVLGTGLSALFLIGMAIVNIFIFRAVYRTFRQVRHDRNYQGLSPDALMSQGGVMAHVFRPLYRMLTGSWHMYPVGFLFGLGFETATEVALLGVSSSAAVNGLSLGTVMIFPVLFTVGMTLVDTADGILMASVYGWAFVRPIEKLYYNLAITIVSSVVALLVGGLEAVGLLKSKLELSGGVWDLVENLDDNFGGLGFFIIAVFVLSWIGSIVLYRVKHFDRLWRG
jgi:nickel/cobalt transporter (NiCoT) family protein